MAAIISLHFAPFDGFQPYRLMARSRASISGVRPPTRSLISRAEPVLIVQPSVPWPVLRKIPLIFVGPMTGVPSGVIGRRPDQKDALETSPPGNRSVTECSSVLRRCQPRRLGSAGSYRAPP